jgi:MoaA/NifB/PqqE/SkfB family radical SAM enzyme
MGYECGSAANSTCTSDRSIGKIRGPLGKRPTFVSGLKLFFLRLTMGLAFLKYVLCRGRYPLFLLGRKKGGLLKTVEIGKALGVKKAVRFGGHVYFDLAMPRYPSPAFDHMVANGGLNVAVAGTPHKRHMDAVVLAVSSKCALRCQHCYERFNIGAEEAVPIAKWREVVEKLQHRGVGNIVISGGEPMLRFDDVITLLETADKRLSDFHINTSGYGVTPERVLALKQAGLNAAGVGLDDLRPHRQDKLRGYTGAHAQAVAALKMFNDAGVFTYATTCVTKDLVRSGELWDFYALTKELNVGIVYLMEPMPIGGYQSAGPDVLLSADEKNAVVELYLRGNADPRFRDYPLLFYPEYIETRDYVGCRMGGLAHSYIDSRGNVRPCLFTPVSFGNILAEDVNTIYDQMRAAIPRPIKGKCPSFCLAKTIEHRKNCGEKIPVLYRHIEADWRQILG